MSLPVSVDWTPTYLAKLPPRPWGDPFGDCVAASMCYAMELRGILQGYPAVRLSERFLFVVGEYPVVAATTGVCSEALWPMVVPSDFGNDYAAFMAAVNATPSLAAYTDAQNYKLVDYEYPMDFGYPTTRAGMIEKVQTYIAAGIPLCVFYPPNHEVVAWGYDQNGVLGLDSRSANPGTYSLSYDTIFTDSIMAIKSVLFKGTASLPPPTGNTQMLIDTIVADAGALVLGKVTQAQIDKLKADVGLLVADGTAPPTTGTSPDGTIIPPAASITDASGGVWTLGTVMQPYGYPVLLNGVQATQGGQAIKLAWQAGVIRETISTGSTRYWDGKQWVVG